MMWLLADCTQSCTTIETVTRPDLNITFPCDGHVLVR
jgi:hypothetical protein